MANEWTNWKEHGITKDTPDSILFVAGTIHQGLTFSGDKWNFAESIIGATNGGSKVSMKPEVQDIEVDGKLIKAKGLMMKVGETATMEINFAEISPEIIKKGLIAQEGNSTATGYKVIESKPDIEAGDYFENFAFVGRTVSKKPIIVDVIGNISKITKTNKDLTEKLGFQMLLNTDAQQIYTMYGGRVKVVSGTKVIDAYRNIGYVRAFSGEELKALFGESFNATRLTVTTYNGDDVAQETHFYEPEIWKGEIFQYFYPTSVEGKMRINYKMEYVYGDNS